VTNNWKQQRITERRTSPRRQQPRHISTRRRFYIKEVIWQWLILTHLQRPVTASSFTRRQQFLHSPTSSVEHRRVLQHENNGKSFNIFNQLKIFIFIDFVMILIMNNCM